jgi:hypothetical protein
MSRALAEQVVEHAQQREHAQHVPVGPGAQHQHALVLAELEELRGGGGVGAFVPRWTNARR